MTDNIEIVESGDAEIQELPLKNVTDPGPDPGPGAGPVIDKTTAVQPMVFDAQSLISQAIEKETAVETMERLLVMRKELKKEAARDLFFKALSGFQAECPIIKKSTPVFEKNGTVRYKYATLDDIVSQVKSVLLKFGFSYIIKSIQEGDKVGAKCQAFHEGGHSEESEFKVPIDPKAYMNAAQKVASALTFSKRYAFCDIFGIMTGTGDDDGVAIGDPEPPMNPAQPPSNRPSQGFNGPPGKMTFNNAPEQNKNVYTNIMKLMRAQVNNQDIFVMKERKQTKEKADAVIGDIKKLNEVYQILNKIAIERREFYREDNKK